jgi:hypothetical protein
MPYNNGYSEEYLDRLDNGSIPVDNKSYNKRKFVSIYLLQASLSFPEEHPTSVSLFIVLIFVIFVFVKINFLQNKKKVAEKEK